MYGKFILAAVLIAFLYVQLGTSLECHSCTTSSGCTNPSKTTCNIATANRTQTYLNSMFKDVNSSYAESYNCLFHNITSQNGQSVNTTYWGCSYRDSKACSLTLHDNKTSSLTVKTCTFCSGNLCNSAPGSYSFSTFTILATALTALMAKTFVH